MEVEQSVNVPIYRVMLSAAKHLRLIFDSEAAEAE